MKMELSFELYNVAYKDQKRQLDSLFIREPNQTSSSSSCQGMFDDKDIIDLSRIHLDYDDDCWLCEPRSNSEIDLTKWLYEQDDFVESSLTSQLIQYHLGSELQNSIDTRTFTRPKKRSIRPSIEKYNQELYEVDVSAPKLTDSGIQSNESPGSEAPNFDLTLSLHQSHYFENMLAEKSSQVDMFQNMSPPSLVNSMCSSTFTNLMESSFIRNDPVLREIRDTDYTQSILQHEIEPMFQSINFTADVNETFSKKVTFPTNDTFKIDNADETIYLDATYVQDKCTDDKTFQDALSFEEQPEAERPILNDTYQRSPKFKSDINDGTIKVNTTFAKDDCTLTHETLVVAESDQDANVTLTPKSTTRLLSRRDTPSMDLNRLAYVTDSKRNSLTGSTDSTDNLDYMSLSSGSSKTQSIERIEPEFFLVQSTPIQNNPLRKVFENTFTHQVSPVVVADKSSDSGETFQVKSPTNTGTITKQKSLGHIVGPSTRAPASKLQMMANNMRGSYPNLKTATLPQPMTKKTNLNVMGYRLKGSYTSLKPICANLPVAPPLQSAQYRPQVAARTSGLPRPSSGIPKAASSSRIPGPRSAGHVIPRPR